MSDLTEPVLLAGLDGISALGVFDLDGRRSGWTSEGLETGLSIGESRVVRLPTSSSYFRLAAQLPRSPWSLERCRGRVCVRKASRSASSSWTAVIAVCRLCTSKETSLN